METTLKPVCGVMKGGVAVPEAGAVIPDGTKVEIHIAERKLGPVVEFSPEDKEEFEGWERLSDEAWQKFLQWEKEQPE